MKIIHGIVPVSHELYGKFSIRNVKLQGKVVATFITAFLVQICIVWKEKR